ncbi:SusD/RagB family nutrient-binding outer membrane lipoprotein [Salinibacter altiplanensis]|uniref:SusD/RagB family nutrient-binding outer membrane lipoprotein n=1 Tax=Salinibacter altiplanensis TaxID=1803181 RepID=UPI000C9FAB4F|nr:SusD/RagB family nutrient-binding outer membrane lipoprotein [Salinibacter altiplanensis]
MRSFPRSFPLRVPSLFTLLAVLTVAVASTGCDSRFEDVNDNPNEPEEVTPNLLLPNIIRSSVNTSVNTAHTTGNLVLQYTAKVSFATEIDRYNWAGVGYWQPLYDDLRNVEDMIRIAQERDQPQYEGAGLVLKSWIFSMLTNAYGDVPYSESVAVQEGIETPAYDRQEAIYRGMLADLRRANDLLTPGSGAIQGDVLYEGDIAKWKKLANSLRLRLLMRLSEKDITLDLDGSDVSVSEAFQSITSAPDTAPVFTSNDDNAALEYLDSRPNEWPRHTSRIGTFRTFKLSETLTDTLTHFDDPRLSVFGDPTAASVEDGSPEFVGVPNGLTDDASDSFNGGRDFQSGLNFTRYFDEPDAAKGLIMTYAEVLFLKAEAAERGWISADAQTHYRDAVEASFEQYGQSTPSGYFGQPGVSYPTSNQTQALERIGTQKWIALFYTGLEGWFNWRRTGIPDIDPSVDNVNGDQIPVRFRYPESEQSLNADNYEAAVERQGADDINTEMWLLVE